MAFGDEIAAKSSNIRAFQYDEEAQVMRVHFHGGRAHDYPETSPEAFEAQTSAESVGKHFHANHRHRPNSKVGE